MIDRLPRALAVVCCLAVAGVLTACGGSIASLNPFKEKEIPLPGDRISVMKPQDSPAIDPGASAKPISLPPAKTNQAWSQPGGVASNAPGHLSWSASGNTVWRASAGSGSSSDGRLTASPIVYQGRVFTLDAEGVVAAFSESSGERLWRISLSPENESGKEGFGGGLAADGGKLMVTTGFGTVVALNLFHQLKLRILQAFYFPLNNVPSNFLFLIAFTILSGLLPFTKNTFIPIFEIFEASSTFLVIPPVTSILFSEIKGRSPFNS